MIYRVRRVLSVLMAAAMALIIPCCAPAYGARTIEVRLALPEERQALDAAIWHMGALPPISGKTTLVSKPKPRAQPTDGVAPSIAGRALSALHPLRGKIDQGMLPFALAGTELTRGPRAP